MIVTITHPWRSPYGEASWIGTVVIHDGIAVGTVVDEEASCKRTALLHLEIVDGVLPEGAEGFEHFELDTEETFVLEIFEDEEEDEEGG